VADAFDAMTSDRVYRRGRPYAEAAQELDDWAGKQFDGAVVAAFHRVPQADWDDLHQKSLVKSSGEFELNRMLQSLEYPFVLIT
jgi:HD-GYP domain-containing protein (c-di-GMP phosphodiesterase class II)